MNTNQARRTLKLTSICLAAMAISACGGPAATDCSQTATCNMTTTTDGGQAGDNSMSAEAASTMDAAQVDAVGVEAMASDAGTARGCENDGDCALGTVCSSHACVPGCSDQHGCQTGEACCDGQCFNMKTDVKHCGGCAACAVANATAACTNGVCGVASCSPGFVDCDGKADNGCELAKPMGPSVPNPTRPVAGDYTGSFRADPMVNTLRPTFRWTAATPDTCGAVSYQIQLDDSCKPGEMQSCAFASPEVDATVATNSFQPATVLAVQKTQPVGTRYYWRVRACDAAKVCSSWSTVRYVEVGRVRDDLNGDGYSDLLVRGGADNLYVYFGGDSISPQPSIHGLPGNFFAFAGDLDADGYGDLVVADPNTVQGGGSFGAILVYPGKATWAAELGAHETIYHSADGLHGFPSEVSAAGDLDGDGKADIMASLASENAVSIYLDVAGRYATPATLTVSGNVHLASDGFGRAGDVDGDGLTEVAILSRPTPNWSDVEFFRGAASPSDQPFMLQGLDGAVMMTLRAAGDLDGDGFDDVAFAGLKGSQSALVTLRGNADFATAGGILATRTFSDDSVAFRGLAGGWDTNNDGRCDIYWTAVEGYALLSIPGAATFTAQSPAVTVDASTTGSVYGTALVMGDYDGDGKADLVVASTLWNATDNPTAGGAVSLRLAKGPVLGLTAPSLVGFGAALGH